MKANDIFFWTNIGLLVACIALTVLAVVLSSRVLAAAVFGGYHFAHVGFWTGHWLARRQQHELAARYAARHKAKPFNFSGRAW